MDTKIIDNIRSKSTLLLLFVSFIFVTLFSYSTSPLYGNIYNHPDSAIFQIIGKYWVDGALPYRDLWDLKGPYIFFVDAIGYFLLDSYVGIYIIQIVNIWITLIFTFCTYRIYFEKNPSFLLTILSLFSLSYTYQCGNLCEEYLLPFLSLSFFLLLKYLKKVEIQEDYKHPSSYAIIYGIVLGLSLMSRLTNALSVSGAVAVIAITLLLHKSYSNLVKNIVAFLIGFTVSSVPFMVYFYLHDALDLLFNGTLFYPFQYASNPSKDILGDGIHFYLLSFGNSILLLIISIIIAFRQHQTDVRSIMWFCASLLPFIWFCQGNGLGQYGMTVLPLLAVSMIEIKRLSMKKFAIVVVILVVIGFLSKARFAFLMQNYQNPTVIAYKAFLKESNVDYNSFVAYNCDPNFYLAENVKPAAPFFSLQDFAIGRNETLRKLIIHSFNEKRPHWILLQYDEDETPAINELLNKYYRMVKCDKENKIVLYECKYKSNV